MLSYINYIRCLLQFWIKLNSLFLSEQCGENMQSRNRKWISRNRNRILIKWNAACGIWDYNNNNINNVYGMSLLLNWKCFYIHEQRHAHIVKLTNPCTVIRIAIHHCFGPHAFNDHWGSILIYPANDCELISMHITVHGRCVMVSEVFSFNFIIKLSIRFMIFAAITRNFLIH